MENNDRFKNLKETLLERAVEKHACKEGYNAGKRAKTWKALMKVVRDNFSWLCRSEVLTWDILSMYEDEFKKHGIYFNENYNDCGLAGVRDACLYINSGKAWVGGNSFVYARLNCYVNASGDTFVEADDDAGVSLLDNCKCFALGKSSVYADGNAIVTACGSSTVHSYGNSHVRAFSNSSVIAKGYSSVKASMNAKVFASECSSVHAGGASSVELCEQSRAFLCDVSTLNSSEEGTIAYINSKDARVVEDDCYGIVIPFPDE